MRERLVVTLVAMTVAMIAIFGAVRAYSTADLVKDEESRSVSHSADVAVVAVAALGDAPVTTSFLKRLGHEGQTVSYVGADGRTISTRTKAAGDDDISATRPVEGQDGARVVLTQDAAVASARVSDALSSLVLLGLGLAALAAAIGWLLATRFAHPFHQLAADATRIGEGKFDTPVHRSNMREAAELGDALRSAAAQLDTLVGRERELAVIASHELRTPITALRLSIEDLTLWPETPEVVADELRHGLTQVDRLSDVVTNLLEGGGERRLDRSSQIDLTAVAAEAADRWAPRAAALGRDILVTTAAEPAVVWADRETVDEVADVLLDNALVHGAGTVTLEIFKDSTHFRFRVHDEGRRVIEPGLVHTSPAGPQAGLTGAAARAESLGGFIGVGDAPTSLVSLVLPQA